MEQLVLTDAPNIQTAAGLTCMVTAMLTSGVVPCLTASPAGSFAGIVSMQYRLPSRDLQIVFALEQIPQYFAVLACLYAYISFPLCVVLVRWDEQAHEHEVRSPMAGQCSDYLPPADIPIGCVRGSKHWRSAIALHGILDPRAHRYSCDKNHYNCNSNK
eukprot:2946103-Amphidinium_carterae.2